MNVLGVDCSTARASLAFLADGVCLLEDEWEERRGVGMRLLERLLAGMRQTGWDWASLDRLVVGRGPGNYTGLRLSLTVIRSLALPGGTPVRALSSGLAVASTCLDETGASRATVLGDARRGQVWAGVFERNPGGVSQVGGWRLIAWADAAREIDSTIPCASSGWSGLSVRPEFESLREHRWMARDVFPSARVLARLAGEEESRGEASAEATPIYLHPAVAGP